MSELFGSTILELILSLRDEAHDKALSVLKAIDAESQPQLFAAAMRYALHQSGTNKAFVKKLLNMWRNNGEISLKSTVTDLSVEVLSDGTVDFIAPYLSLFLAAYGIRANITVGQYDSVEFEAFEGESKDVGLTIVLLSDYWLKRHYHALADKDQAELQLAQHVSAIKDQLCAKRSGHVMMTSFVSGAWPSMGGLCAGNNGGSWSHVRLSINHALAAQAGAQFTLVDSDIVLQLAGGVAANGRLGHIRMRLPYEETGFISMAREMASLTAHVFGRSHRALLTDWDNTLWGGEVGEAGFDGIVCGQEDPDGYGYYLLQSYMQELTQRGVLLAAVSRNRPEMEAVLTQNPHVVLKPQHFASMALHWGNKSDSVCSVVSDLSFGADLMVFIDDNHADLVEVAMAHPEIDLILAGPEPDQSLNRISQGRFFNTAYITKDDATRSENSQKLKKQRALMAQASSPEAFRKSLDIHIDVSGLNAKNTERVLQLLQKTNQFNLTTRRHDMAALEALQAQGAQFGVFDYTDKFGAQGIIGVMIIVPHDDMMDVNTWLMSCRVLNRGVEEYMLKWARGCAPNLPLKGTYIETKKNSLVKDIYPNMGFSALPEKGTYTLPSVGK